MAPFVTPNRRIAPHRSAPEVIGPATALISPNNFAQAASLALERAKVRCRELEILLRDSGVREEVGERCSVEDLYQENTRIHADENYTSELVKWHEPRLYPNQGPLSEDDEEGSDPESDQSEQPPKAKKPRGKGKGKLVDLQYEREGSVEGKKKRKPTAERVSKLPCLDPKILKFLEEADTCSLKILKPLPDLDYFVRKTRISDYNTLSELRPCTMLTSAKPPNSSTLSSLIYHLTFHPISRTTSRLPYATRSQELILLGSTTLWELKSALLAGGDEIPMELPPEEGEEDDWEEDEWGNPVEGSKRKVKWSTTQRDTGSAFGIQGHFYPDKREGKVDYADMLVNLIDSIPWTGRKESKKRTPSVVVESDDSEEELEIADSSKPDWKVGSSMQRTMLGDIDLKIGEGYYYVHQGNCEHIWTVDRIRNIHPSDPKITHENISTYPYPYSSFLSRINQAKCRVCDRDPGCVVTIDDELAGETPSLMCARCFEMMHGSNEDGHVIVIPKLM